MQSDGDDVFIRSLQQYLRANEFSTGSSHKLWETVAQVAGLPITRWMDQWTYHGGFPLVSATLQGSQVTVSQVNSLHYAYIVVAVCYWSQQHLLVTVTLAVTGTVTVTVASQQLFYCLLDISDCHP